MVDEEKKLLQNQSMCELYEGDFKADCIAIGPNP
jgi:hypothetical protein